MFANTISNFRNSANSLSSGVLLSFTIAGAASFLSDHYGAPTMLFALLIGMAFHFLSEEGKCIPGIDFTASTLLRIGVALLGAKVTLAQIFSLKLLPLLLIPALVILTIISGFIFAWMFKKNWAFGLLSGGAVAICGASAALAISAVLGNNKQLQRDTLFTVIAVTTLSTLAMIAYPIFYKALDFNDVEIGILLGATIHDVAQVVGAGYAISEETGNIATYVKLLRVSLLPIIVICITITWKANGNKSQSDCFPWFAIWFAVILLLNSFGIIPEMIRANMELTSKWLLIAAISALGVKTSLKAMKNLGAQHILVVVMETVFLFALATGILILI